MRRLGGAGDVEGKLRLDLAVREHAHAILGAADHAGRDQRFGGHGRLGVELLGIDRGLDAGQRHDVLKLLAKMLLKPRFGRRR